jgi:transcriptional regulator with XRE-family HTH domain
METASGSAPAAELSLGAEDDSARCDRCGDPFGRRTNERTCPDCLAPLRQHRKAAGLTQVELARRVACRPATISDLERKPFNLALDLAESIARELDVDVLDAFPKLEITKVEAQKILHKTWRDVERLTASGELPCDSDGYWHRIPYRAVFELSQELDKFRRDWISFTAAAEQSRLPRWVVHRLHDAGEFGDDVKVLDESARPRYFVRRSRFDDVYRRLISEYRGVRCPRCKLPVKLGRKAHARCLGPLAVRAYWKIGADAETRADVAREHGDRVRGALRRPSRLVQDWTGWYVNRFGRKPSRAQMGRWAGWKSRGRPSLAVKDAGFAEKVAEVERLRKAHPAWGARTIAREVGLSRWKVRDILSALSGS